MSFAQFVRLPGMGFLTRVYTLSTAMILLLVSVTWTSLNSISLLQKSTLQISQQALPRLKTSQSFFSSLQTMTLSVSGALSEDRGDRVDAYETRFAEAHKQASGQLENLKTTDAGDSVDALRGLLDELAKLSRQTMAGHREVIEQADKMAVAIRDLQLQFSRYKQDLLRTQFATKDDFVAYSVKDFIIPFEQMEAVLFDAIGTGSSAKLLQAREKVEGMLPEVRKKLEFVIADLKPHEDNRTDYEHTYRPEFESVVNNISLTGEGTLARYLSWLQSRESNLADREALIAKQEEAGRLVAPLIEQAESLTQHLSSQAQDISTGSFNNILLMAVISTLIALLMSLWLSRTMRRGLKAVSVSLRQLATGDMQVRCHYTHQDEFGQISEDVNQVAGNMQESLRQLRESAQQQDAIAHANSDDCSEANRGLEQQRESISQLATAMTEMESSFAEVARHAMDTSALVNQVEGAVVEGSNIMTDAIRNTNELSDQLQGSVERIANVETQSEQIGQILDVISGIAEQTNLLALNAAIEAARAGEQGRGFAVVADEVRNLARRTGESTAEIQQRIDALQKGIFEAVESVRESKDRMMTNVTQVDSADGTMQQIRERVEEIATMSRQISEATQQQQLAAEEISLNMNLIHQAADTNMTIVHRITKTSSRQANMADEQQQLCLRYKI
ncbi:hypothetical protein BTA51_02550 [Hahella sp. CCB-MM4]|uniref:methyl-accepting chemotaxis protein n=1 Tax=Hahella sp. (strain CCB-MM4) TaxID=1926491 RepID=UPI000B9B3D2F|nr:methyl-accepting chemotaxis protein [Hahella sp. CCB-MM4]OZG75283.1 hypothetical protein BTA51_02550 [Hahella sp. CCB-MM4]